MVTHKILKHIERWSDPEEREALRFNLMDESFVWTAQVTLVSGTLGYYFGSERNRNNSEN